MDELQISGKRFISSRRAAKDNGYTPDYIGQLIRAGKVRGQKVGRAWYVEADSFALYLESGNASAPVAQPEPQEVQEVVESPASEIPEATVHSEIDVQPKIVEAPVAEVVEEQAAETGVKEEPIVVRIVQADTAPAVHPPVVQEEKKISQDVEAPVVVKIRKARTEGLTYVASEEAFIPQVESRQAITSVMPGAREEIGHEPQEETRAPVRASRGWGDAGVLFAGFAVFVACAVIGSSMATTLHLEAGSPASVGYVIEW